MFFTSRQKKIQSNFLHFENESTILYFGLHIGILLMYFANWHNYVVVTYLVHLLADVVPTSFKNFEHKYKFLHLNSYWQNEHFPNSFKQEMQFSFKVLWFL